MITEVCDRRAAQHPRLPAIARLVEEFGICETLKVARPDDVEFREVEGNEGNFDDGLWVQEVINAVEISHHERRWVSLPLESPAGAAAGRAR